MALFAVLRTAALFKSRAETKKNQYTNVLAACTLLDIPTGWDPRAKQSHTMALFAVLRTAALFKSRAETKKNQYTNVLAACTLLDIPTGWDPRAKQSHTMALFAVLRTAALFKSRAETKKNQYTNVYWFFLVGAAGFEPTASSSRTRRATNCAMPRKYRSQLTAVWLGMRESNSHK